MEEQGRAGRRGGEAEDDRGDGRVVRRTGRPVRTAERGSGGREELAWRKEEQRSRRRTAAAGPAGDGRGAAVGSRDDGDAVQEREQGSGRGPRDGGGRAGSWWWRMEASGRRCGAGGEGIGVERG